MRASLARLGALRATIRSGATPRSALVGSWPLFSGRNPTCAVSACVARGVSDSAFKKQTPRKKFAILIAGDVTDTTREQYGDFDDIFQELLRDPDREDEVWDAYNVYKGEFPDAKTAASYDAFVITGSGHDAHAKEDWIDRLNALCREVYDRGEQRILGVCFGHQSLSNALGGRSGRADVGWEAGLRDLEFLPSFSTRFPTFSPPQPTRILEIHQDQVLELPPGAEVLAQSPETPVEMYAVGPRILCVQGHPEMNTDILVDLVDERLRKRVIGEELAFAITGELYKSSPRTEQLEELLVYFLKDEPDPQASAASPADPPAP